MFQNFLAAMGFYNFLIIFSYDSSGGDLYEEYGHDRPGVCLGEGQTEAYLKDMSMTGLASVWVMARRRPI